MPARAGGYSGASEARFENDRVPKERVGLSLRESVHWCVDQVTSGPHAANAVNTRLGAHDQPRDARQQLGKRVLRRGLGARANVRRATLGPLTHWSARRASTVGCCTRSAGVAGGCRSVIGSCKWFADAKSSHVLDARKRARRDMRRAPHDDGTWNMPGARLELARWVSIGGF